jgi:hypothetical protein
LSRQRRSLRRLTREQTSLPFCSARWAHWSRLWPHGSLEESEMEKLTAYWTWMVAVTGTTKAAAAISVAAALLLLILMAAAVSAIVS